jgi:hypothetical protein
MGNYDRAVVDFTFSRSRCGIKFDADLKDFRPCNRFKEKKLSFAEGRARLSATDEGMVKRPKRR